MTLTDPPPAIPSGLAAAPSSNGTAASARLPILAAAACVLVAGALVTVGAARQESVRAEAARERAFTAQVDRLAGEVRHQVQVPADWLAGVAAAWASGPAPPDGVQALQALQALARVHAGSGSRSAGSGLAVQAAAVPVQWLGWAVPVDAGSGRASLDLTVAAVRSSPSGGAASGGAGVDAELTRGVAQAAKAGRPVHVQVPAGPSAMGGGFPTDLLTVVPVRRPDGEAPGIAGMLVAGLATGDLQASLRRSLADGLAIELGPRSPDIARPAEWVAAPAGAGVRQAVRLIGSDELGPWLTVRATPAFDAAVAPDRSAAVAVAGALLTLLAAGLAGHRVARRGRARTVVQAAGHGLASIAAMANRGGVAVALTDREGRIVWVGPGFPGLSGCSPDAVVGWALADVLATGRSAAQRPAVQALLEEALADPQDRAPQPAQPAQRELALSMDDGRVLWIELVARAHLDAAGGVVGAIVAAVDIGARKAGERRLAVALADAARLSTELGLLAAVARHAVDGIVLTDVDGRVTWANPSFEQMSGRTLDELLGRKPGELLQCEQTDPAEVARLRSAIAGRARCTAELLNRAKDGRTYWVRIDLQPLLAADGSHRGFVAIQTDVTERRREIDDLRAGLALMEAAFEAVPLPVTMKGRDGRLHRINAAAAALFGRPPDTLLGRTTADILPGEQGRAQDVEDAQLLREPGARRYEATVARETGPPVRLLVSKRTVLDSQGVALGVVASLVDLSARHDAEVASRAAREAAEASNRAQSAFLATMSHEIRTPMNGVIGHAELLACDRRLDADLAEQVGTILASAKSLLELIDGILDFSRIESGRLVLAAIPFDLVDLVEGVARELAASAAQRGVALDVVVLPGLAPMRVGDPLRVRQVLAHLVGNAVKFGGGGGAGQGSARLRVEPAGDRAVRFEVADDGIGMDADTVARLFQPFTQAEASSTRRYGGAGLGLAITRRLVQLMGGTIEVDSRPGEGSRFRVTLPLAPDLAAAPAGSPNAGADLTGVACVIAPWPTLPVDDLTAWLEAAGARVRRLGPGWAGEGLEDADSRPGGGEAPAAPAPVLLLGAAAGRASLPAVAAPLDPADLDERVAPPTDAQARALGPWILVVEDDPTNRGVITRQLALLGCAAQVVNDGEQALEAWRAHRHALVLTDLHMPVLDGLGLARSIRASETRLGLPRTPVLVLTANADQGEAAQARAAGVDEYLVKPIPMAQLRAALNHWMPALRASAPAAADPAGTVPGDRCEAEGPIVDLGVLVDLVGDDPGIVRGLVDEFRRCAVRHRGRLVTAWHAADSAGMAGAAHALKSASRSIGAGALATTCEAIERGARGRTSAVSGALVALFEERVEAVLRALPVGTEAAE